MALIKWEEAEPADKCKVENCGQSAAPGTGGYCQDCFDELEAIENDRRFERQRERRIWKEDGGYHD